MLAFFYDARSLMFPGIREISLFVSEISDTVGPPTLLRTLYES